MKTFGWRYHCRPLSTEWGLRSRQDASPLGTEGCMPNGDQNQARGQSALTPRSRGLVDRAGRDRAVAAGFTLVEMTIVVAIVLILISIAAPSYRNSVIRAKEALGSPTDKGSDRVLALANEHEHNRLEVLSSDGRFVLLYATKAPVRILARSDGARLRPGEPGPSDDTLRVVELESGREVGRIETTFFPRQIRFLPGTDQVFYYEPHEGPTRGGVFKVWEFRTEETTLSVTKSAGPGIGQMAFLDKERALGIMSVGEGEWHLGELRLPGCKAKIIPETRSGNFIADPVLSPDRRHLAYAVVGRHQLIVRDVETMEIVGKLHPPGLAVYQHFFTPDGKHLLAFAGDKGIVRGGTKRYLLLYRTLDYELTRTLHATEWETLGSDPSAMAVSPDGKMIAIGYTRKEKGFLSNFLRGIRYERAVIILYYLETLKEVARVSHPRLRRRRSDPFQAKVGRLIFTPDGKYLLSSTHDTRVWRIETSKPD